MFKIFKNITVTDLQGKEKVITKTFKNQANANEWIVSDKRKTEYSFIRVNSTYSVDCDHSEIQLTGKFQTEVLECSCGFKIPF